MYRLHIPALCSTPGLRARVMYYNRVNPILTERLLDCMYNVNIVNTSSNDLHCRGVIKYLRGYRLFRTV